MVSEPQLDAHNIQGNILAGFKKDNQILVGLEILDVEQCKTWLSQLAPYVASLHEVLAFNRLFKAMVAKSGDKGAIQATWVNIAFSYAGVAKLASAAEADLLPDSSFRAGLLVNSEALGDPTDPTSAYHRTNWKVGAPGNVPDILLIVASDVADLATTTAQARIGTQSSSGCRVIYQEVGQTRQDERGHEHFGFKDCISQPAVRGTVSMAKGDYLSPRLISRPTSIAEQQSQPGRPLIMPGVFVLGYETQSLKDGTPLPAPALAAPWHKNGSFLVFRRLRQDVAAFRGFLASAQTQLSAQIPGITEARIGATFVGRWPDGSPLVRAPDGPNSAMATDMSANAFQYANPMPRTTLKPHATADASPSAGADPLGLVCPHWAHVRKVNPRDDSTNLGDGFDTLSRRMIRRGIPYGPSLPDGAPDDGVDRGLLFLAYQVSIAGAFEKITQDWTNQRANPQPDGYDPIIGQSDEAGRRRTVSIRRSTGLDVPLEIDTEWVFPTGGGYFFAPSIDALTTVLAAQSPKTAATPLAGH